MQGKEMTVTVGAQVDQEVVGTAVRALWASAVSFDLGFGEMLYFRDNNAWNSWQENGMTESLANSMIQVICTPDTVTFATLEICDEEHDRTINRIIQQII